MKKKIAIVLIPVLIAVAGIAIGYKLGVRETVRSAELETIHDDGDYEIYFGNIDETHLYK